VKLKLVTPPAVEPVSLDEAKAHLRLEVPDDDAKVSALIVAARLHCETVLRQALITQTWDLFVDAFPWGGGYYNRALRQMGPSPFWLPSATYPIELPRPPLRSVVSVSYYNGTGDLVVIDPSTYQVSTGTPGRVAPAFGQVWPVPQPRMDAVAIRYVAGYGDDGASIPQNIREALLLMVGHWYEHRSAADEVSLTTVPDAVDSLLAASDHGGYA
jgi:hypothetical protein